MPTPSTWPCTTWPPSGSPARSAPSRLTRSPARRRAERAALERLVHGLERERARGQVDAVRQTPSTETESPSRMPSRDPVGRDPEGRSIGAVVDGGDGCELLDDAGEHVSRQGGSRTQASRRISAPTRSGSSDTAASAARRCVAGCKRLAEQAGRGGIAEDARRHEQRHPVDQPVAQQRAGQRRAALAQHGLHLARGQQPAARSARLVDGERLDARGLQRRAAVGRRVGRHEHQHRALGRRSGRGCEATGRRARAVDHDPQRLPLGRRIAVARRQRGVVGDARCRSRPARRRPPPASACTSARLSGDGDPARVAGARRRAAVERDRRLVRDVRPAERDGRPEAGVLAPRGEADRGRRDRPRRRRRRRRARRANPRAVHLAVRIAGRGHDARHAGRDQRVGARRRAAGVRARLEADVRRRAAGARRRPRRSADDLGVRRARAARGSPRRRPRRRAPARSRPAGSAPPCAAPARRAPACARGTPRRRRLKLHAVAPAARTRSTRSWYAAAGSGAEKIAEPAVNRFAPGPRAVGDRSRGRRRRRSRPRRPAGTARAAPSAAPATTG